MATYLAVGDAGRILCSGTGCSGSQDSGTDEVLFAAARSSFTFSNGVRLRLVVGEDGTILRMRSDGRWRRFSSGTTRNLNGVSIAPGTDVCWAVGDEGTILKSTDAGATWGVQTSGISLHLNSVHAVSQEIVWAAGDHAVVLQTTDGGANWELRHWGRPLSNPFVRSLTSKHFRSIVGFSDNRAAVVGDNGVFLECDELFHWKLHAVGTADLTALAIGDKLMAATGPDGAVFAREDVFFDGFKKADTGTSKNLNGIVINSGRIIAVGDDGMILISSDRGATWFAKPRGSKHLRGVA